jgi:hypothetical protein
MHHIDGDHSNNDPSNWACVHKFCHIHHHQNGVKKSQEHRRKISEAMKGNRNGRYGRAGKPNVQGR